MKKISLILSLLCLTCSMSFGQILQWTKTITVPGSSEWRELDTIKAISNNISTSAIMIDAVNNSQLYWFDSKGKVIHSDSIAYGRFYGITSTRLVVLYESQTTYNTAFKTFTRKSSIVTSTEIDSGTTLILGFSEGGNYEIPAARDAGGFFKSEKGVGDTWIVKRYIF